MVGMRTPLPDHDAMVDNILRVYYQASDAQRRAGADWYPFAFEICEEIGTRTGTSPHRIAYVMAALSPRNPWRWNVADAYRFAYAAMHHESMPVATTFKRNAEAAWRALTGENEAPWKTSALKVRSFVNVIMGEWQEVVVDVWTARVATNGERDDINDGEYRRIADAFVDAARRVNRAPAILQAITWIVAQDAGLGSGRKGRHDRSFKKGTPDVVKAMFDA
jgi:hypothetical protein